MAFIETKIIFWGRDEQSDFVIPSACGTCQVMCFSLFMVTSIHSIWKRVRNSKKLGNKSKDHRRFESQKERNRADESSLKEKKRNRVRKK